jgi:hypothetical protein
MEFTLKHGRSSAHMDPSTFGGEVSVRGLASGCDPFVAVTVTSGSNDEVRVYLSIEQAVELRVGLAEGIADLVAATEQKAEGDD